jgi:hypothetical protein
MRITKASSITQGSTPTLESALKVAQFQSAQGGEYVSSHTMAQMLDAMQKQGWSITCPPDSFTPSSICAVMVGKLSRHAT